jgi:hypothetical protein
MRATARLLGLTIAAVTIGAASTALAVRERDRTANLLLNR